MKEKVTILISNVESKEKQFSSFSHHVANEKVFYYQVDYVNNAKKHLVTISFDNGWWLALVVSISDEKFLKGICQPSPGNRGYMSN